MSQDLSPVLSSTSVEAIISEREPDGNFKSIENYVDINIFHFPKLPKIGDKIQISVEEPEFYEVVDIFTLFDIREDSEGRYTFEDGIYNVIVIKLDNH